jgi:hypothetical protein
MDDTTAREDPLAWPVIRPGWKVLALDGSAVGEVDEIAGDARRDIFDGLSIVRHALARPCYVLGEQVGAITQGVVQLTIGPDEVAQLPEYLEPATSAQIEPDADRGPRSALRAVESALVSPIERERPVGIRQRVEHLVRRWRG